MNKEKLKKVVRENQDELVTYGMTFIGCLALTGISYRAGHRNATNAWKIAAANFDDYNPTSSPYVTLHVTHKNKKVTDLRFNRKM